MNLWNRLWRRSQQETELEKELLFHLEQHALDLQALGFPPDEARRRARLALGGPEQVKESCRDARGTRWLADFALDFRYTLRTLSHQPGFAAVILLTLALGIGATTAMFTIINGVLLKPLQYFHPERLVTLQEKTEQATQYGNLWAFAYPNYLDCKRDARALAELAAWRGSGGTLSGTGDGEYVNAMQVSAEFFPTLDVNPVQGRAFLPEDDRLGAAPVMIISNGLWQRLYGPSPAAIGSTLTFDAKSYTVVGVLPAGFQFDSEADVFTPFGQDDSPNLQNRSRHPGIGVIARLAPGVTLPQAQSELNSIGHHLAQEYPESNAGRTFIAEPLRADVGDIGPTLWLLLGAVGLVLLIACANVANLLLARAASREREFAMRVALGANHSRLVRQCLTESVILGLCGGALGISLAALAMGPFVSLWPGSLPRAQEIHLDWRVLAFALAISLLTGLLFGLAPILRVPYRALERSVHAGARFISGSSRRLQSSFVICEIALAVVLLVSAGVLARALLRLTALNPGMNVHNVLVTRASLPPDILANPERARAAWREMLDSSRSVPGIESAAIVDTVPMREGNNQVGYSTSPAFLAASQQPLALATTVSPDYLNVMGIPLLKGRFFGEQDRIGNELVIVIDDVFAQQAFGAQDPVGRRLWFPADLSPFSSGSQTADVVRIVGVVGHVRHWGLANDDQAQVRAQFYYPFAQVPDPLVRRWSELMSIAVRTTIPPTSVLSSLRRAVRGSTGDRVLYEIRTLEQLANDSLSRQKFLLLLLGIFAGLAMLLACIGIYGLLAYLTSQRVPEIGLRMALGASARNVLAMVLRQSAQILFVGVAAGAIGAVIAVRILESSVAGVRSIEPLTFAAMVALLVAAAFVASFIPARRASRVDPMTAMRQE
ncbi:MAG TPA: ABC transporter permease [Candidatus Acidoferrales bacterium]